MMTRVKNGWPSLCHICSSMVVALDVAFEIFLSLSLSISISVCVSLSLSLMYLSQSLCLSLLVTVTVSVCLSVSLSLPSARHIPINSTGSPPNAISLAPTPRHFQWWKRDVNGLSL